MISKNVSIVDLDPYTWRNIGEIMDIINPPKKKIYILHSEGSVINVVQSDNSLIDDIEFDLNDIKGSTDKIFNSHTEVEEIHVYDKESLTEYYKALHASSSPDLEFDDHINFSDRLLYSRKGIDIFRKDGDDDGKNFTEKLKDYVYKSLPENCTVVLGIFDQGKHYFNVILGFKKHKLELITTFDSFEADGFKNEVTMDDQELIHNVAKKKFGGPVKVFFMEKGDLKAIKKSCVDE